MLLHIVHNVFTYVDPVVLGINSKKDIVQNTSKDQQQVEQRSEAMKELHKGRNLLGRRKDVGSVFDQTRGGDFGGEAETTARFGWVDVGAVSSGNILNREEMLRLLSVYSIFRVVVGVGVVESK